MIQVMAECLTQSPKQRQQVVPVGEGVPVAQ